MSVSEEFASYPEREGNIVVPHIESGPFYRRLDEAIKNAKKSVWAGVSFVKNNFRMPDGSQVVPYFTEVAERGIEVRLLFWSNSEFFNKGHSIASKATFNIFNACNAQKVLARWDKSEDPKHCHHEKTWIIDAGEPGEVAFIGGITLSGCLNEPDHLQRHKKHDITAEIRGPSCTDYHHHFVQRWNEAYGHKEQYGAWPSAEIANDMLFPTKLSEPCGKSKVQVLRSARGGFLTSTQPTVGREKGLNMAEGEQSIYEAYKAAIKSAKTYIFMENQHFCHSGLMDLLAEALQRGVEVIYLAPSESGIYHLIHYARERALNWQRKKKGPKPDYSDIFLRNQPELAKYPNFTLGSLCKTVEVKKAVQRQEIYVHAKIMIVDDAWFTVGSANLVDISFEKDHTEVNIGVTDADLARKFRCDLTKQHVGVDVSSMSMKEGIEVFKKVAIKNRDCISFRKNTMMQGLAFAYTEEEQASYGATPTYSTTYKKVELTVSNGIISFIRTVTGH